MGEKVKIPEGIQLLRENIVSKANLFGLPVREKVSWTKGLKLNDGGQTILFTGCGYEFLGAARSMTSAIRKMELVGVERGTRLARAIGKLGFNLPGIYARLSAGKGGGELLRAAVRVLQTLGVEFSYLGEEEPCCGGPLYFLGFQKDFVEKARKTFCLLKKRGVRRMIVIVPSCTYTLKELYPHFVEGFDIEVKSILEVLSERMTPMKLPEPIVAAYHDPCLLSRYLGLREEPRRILEMVENLELREPEWTRKEWSTCCGGGGGFEVVLPKLSSLLAQRRAEELLELKPQVIVTSCPGCLLQLEEGLRRTRAEGVKVVDLVQILEKAQKER